MKSCFKEKFFSETKRCRILATVTVYLYEYPLLPLAQVRDRLPHLKVIIQYSPEPVDPAQRDQGVIPWSEFMEIGKVRVGLLRP